MSKSRPNIKANKTVPWKALSEDQLREFYKLLVSHNYTEAAIQVGMDAHYQGDALRRVGYQIFQLITKPGPDGVARLDKLKIDPELQEMVDKAIEQRKVFKGRKPEVEKPGELEFTPTELLDPNDANQLIIGGKNKAALLLHKKFDYLNKNKQALKDVSLSQLGTVFGIMFDKSQIIQGQATENISVLSKNISDDMTAEQSLQALFKMREEDSIKKS